MLWAVGLAVVACDQSADVMAPSPSSLVLDGPAQVKVDSLGPVVAPGAVQADGSEVTVTWTVDNPGVAEVNGDKVRAVGAGTTRVTGTWQDQTVSWTLVVEPAIMLRFRRPPSQVRVGQTVDIQVVGRLGKQKAPVGKVQWTSSDPAVAGVSNGKVTGRSPGVAYISASIPSSEAMLEIEVR